MPLKKAGKPQAVAIAYNVKRKSQHNDDAEGMDEYVTKRNQKARKRAGY